MMVINGNQYRFLKYQTLRFETQSKANFQNTYGGLTRTYHLLISHQLHICKFGVGDSSENGLRLMTGIFVN